MADLSFLGFKIWPSIPVYQYQNLAEQVTAKIRYLGHQYRDINVEADVN